MEATIKQWEQSIDPSRKIIRVEDHNATWELDGDSWYCTHDGDLETEEIEVTSFYGDQDTSYNTTIDSCISCRKQLLSDGTWDD